MGWEWEKYLGSVSQHSSEVNPRKANGHTDRWKIKSTDINTKKNHLHLGRRQYTLYVESENHKA